VKRLPLPLRRMVGDLSNRERVLFGLDLREALAVAAMPTRAPRRHSRAPAAARRPPRAAGAARPAAEAEQAIEAIRSGHVDALVLRSPDGEHGLRARDGRPSLPGAGRADGQGAAALDDGG
jgi:hypothetical protein